MNLAEIKSVLLTKLDSEKFYLQHDLARMIVRFDNCSSNANGNYSEAVRRHDRRLRRIAKIEQAIDVLG